MSKSNQNKAEKKRSADKAKTKKRSHQERVEENLKAILQTRLAFSRR